MSEKKLGVPSRLVSKDIFVIAGSHHEYENLIGHAGKHWAQEMKEKRVFYVNHPDMMSEIPDGARVFVYGNFKLRPDWPLLIRLFDKYDIKPLMIL